MIFVGDLGAQVVALANLTVLTEVTNPANASAPYSLNNTGEVETNAGVVANWLEPQINMGDFECFASVTSGAITTGSTGAWLNLATTRLWTLVRNSVGTSITVLNIRIRRVGTVTDLASANIRLEATVEP